MNNEQKYRALLAEALKIINHQGWGCFDQPVYDAIEAALAEPIVQAEPVAWLVTEHASEFNDYRTKYRAVLDKPKHGGRSLYLHPPAAQPNQHSRDSKELRDLCSQRGVPEGKEFSQFLSAVMDAAGLVRYGRQSKELSEYLRRMCMQYMTATPSAGSQGGDV